MMRSASAATDVRKLYRGISAPATESPGSGETDLEIVAELLVHFLGRV